MNLYISRYEVNPASGKSAREHALQRILREMNFCASLLGRCNRKIQEVKARAKLCVLEKEMVLFAKTKVMKGFRLDSNG